MDLVKLLYSIRIFEPGVDKLYLRFRHYIWSYLNKTIFTTLLSVIAPIYQQHMFKLQTKVILV